MKFLYLIGLLIGFAGMLYIDYHYRLAFWRRPKDTLFVVGVTLAVLLVFDLIGIALGIFTAGHNVVGIFIGHRDLPIEEFFLLTFFGYFTLIMWKVHR